MLSSFARPYIEASVPVLREHGATITTTFYHNLFEAHPELKNLFNMGNQAQGLQQQSLAAAVFAYAANIDNPEVLAPVISRIVNKHCSLGIKSEHYPIVGHHLLCAIKQTLGDAATPDLLKAWEEAYSILANTLIEEERKLYKEASTAAGDYQQMKVTKIALESEQVKSFVLEVIDSATIPSFTPGQYVSVSINLPSGQTQIRQYSLSDSPDKPHLRISVKREDALNESPAGMVSNWLHDSVKVGDLLIVSAPFGDFKPEVTGDGQVVMLSAGVGITPMISALNYLVSVNPNKKVIFAHAARSQLQHAHKTDIADAKAIMPNLVTKTFFNFNGSEALADPQAMHGEMHLDHLPKWNYEDTNVFMCGPIGFMKEQRKALLEAGIPASRIHREVFGPDLLDHIL